MRPKLHIVFACGGTAGHLYPGLAVAAHLRERLPDARMTFVGAGKPLERHPVRAEGFEYATMPAQPVPRNAFLAMRFVTDNVAGYWASRWFLKEQQVSLVIGLGGYAGAATVRAATSRQIPTVILEQNAVPSHATRWLSRSVDMVCAGFDDIRSNLPASTPLVITGNPARPAFEQRFLKERAGEKKETNEQGAAQQRRLVVIGGSGGATSINQHMPLAVQRLGDQLDGWQVVHQTGEGQLQETIERYQEAGVDALVVSYIDEMAPVMFDSDLVVCRAAGTTLAELALAGAPAVLVPYSRDIEAYQLANAEPVASTGAATAIDEASLETSLDEALAAHLAPLVSDHARRQVMAAQMQSLARPDAAAAVTDAICSILGAGTVRLAA